jgi:hypothetical protein
LLDHAATSAIAPAGSDLRVVADVRMVTPSRRVAALRVAMRVTVTDEGEDLRSLERAVKQAVRTLALVALLVALLAAAAVGGAAHHGAPATTAAGGGELIAHASEAGPHHGDAPHHGDRSDRADRSGEPACATTACIAALAVGVVPVAVPAAAAATGTWSTVAAESDRLPRPALAARVVPSPD